MLAECTMSEDRGREASYKVAEISEIAGLHAGNIRTLDRQWQNLKLASNAS